MFQPFQTSMLGIALQSMVAIAALLCGVNSHAATPVRKAVIGHAALNARVAPLWVAEDFGFFIKHGVNANAIFIRQAPVLVAALTAGDVHAAYTGGTTVLTAVTSGADLRTIATLTNKLGYDVVTGPNIKTAKDLRGKKVGVQTLAGTVWMGAMLGLEHLGLDAERDKITFLVIGDQTVATQALESGQIDMTVLDGVFSRRLRQKGFNVLAELGKANIPFSSQGLVARGATLRDQRDLLESLLKGLLEGVAFSLSPRHKPAVVATIMKRLKLKDPASAEEAVAALELAEKQALEAESPTLQDVREGLARARTLAVRMRATSGAS